MKKTYSARRISDPSAMVPFEMEDLGDTRPCSRPDGSIYHGFTSHFRIGDTDVFSSVPVSVIQDAGSAAEANRLRFDADTTVLAGHDIDLRLVMNVTPLERETVDAG